MGENKSRYIIGVDEVGRGPIAGPVTVAAVMMPRGFSFGRTRPNDSKKLSEKKREEWFLFAKRHPDIIFATASVSPEIIDRIGISRAVTRAVARAVGRVGRVHIDEVEVLLDGLLYAPQQYRQKTIIKGDEKEPVISLASIIAKVRRDKYMITLAKRFPEYGFDRHKGYGTKEHYRAIRRYGLSKIHRKSFIKGVQGGV